MEIKKIGYDFSVCKVEDYSLIDLSAEYCFIGKTNDENSLVCITNDVPLNATQRDDGWKAFCIQIDHFIDTLLGIHCPYIYFFSGAMNVGNQVSGSTRRLNAEMIRSRQLIDIAISKAHHIYSGNRIVAGFYFFQHFIYL